MTSLVFNILLLGAAIYFYLQDNHTWTLLAAGFLGFRLFRARLAQIISVVSRLEQVPEEHRANVQLTCRIYLEPVLQHSSIARLFKILKERRAIDAESVESWRGQLLDNFRHKYERQEAFDEVSFNVKNNILFKNGRPHFADLIHHSIIVPYYIDKSDERSMLTSSIEVELEIRLLMVNGRLVLQVGDFDKESSPRTIRGGFLSVYETYTTITSFPMLQFAERHALPTRYLALSAKATETYKDSLAEPRSKKAFADWKALSKATAQYRILIDEHSSNYSYSMLKTVADSFEGQRTAMLERERFESYNTDHSEDWRDPDLGETYWNEYLYVHFRNLSQWREETLSRATRDYYEEQP